jgi:hypothetical protein
MLSNLEEMVKKPLRIGTLCSGTDMPTYVLGELCKHWSDYFGEEVSFVHKFSCEKAAHAQAFIAKHHQPEHIYTDIVQMGQNAAHELRSGTEIAVDEVDVLIGGTECDNYSALNFGTRATASGCFSSGSGTGKSGTTLEGVLAVHRDQGARPHPVGELRQDQVAGLGALDGLALADGLHQRLRED